MLYDVMYLDNLPPLLFLCTLSNRTMCLSLQFFYELEHLQLHSVSWLFSQLYVCSVLHDSWNSKSIKRWDVFRVWHSLRSLIFISTGGFCLVCDTCGYFLFSLDKVCGVCISPLDLAKTISKQTFYISQRFCSSWSAIAYSSSLVKPNSFLHPAIEELPDFLLLIFLV